MSFRYFAQNVCKPQHSFLFICIFLLSLSCCQAVNKYSKEANQPDGVNVEDKDSWKSIDKPFRLAKINLGQGSEGICKENQKFSSSQYNNI